MAGWRKRFGRAWKPALWFVFGELLYGFLRHLPTWGDLPGYAASWIGFVCSSSVFEWRREVRRRRGSPGR